METLNHAEEKMKKAVVVLEEDLKMIRIGMARAPLPNHVRFEYYRSPTPVNQAASVKVVEGRQPTIKPYDHDMLKDIEHAIQTSDTGLVPQSDGEVIRLSVPVLTGGHRKELAKSIHKVGGETKIVTRNIRRDTSDAVREDKELAEDLKKDAQGKIQKLMDKIRKSIDSAVDTRTREIMKV